MSLKLHRRKGTANWYVRGSVGGIRIEESAGTGNRKLAEQYRLKREQDLYAQSLHGDRATATFASAAESYMMAGGERAYLARLLEYFGARRLKEIDQGAVDICARALYPSAAPATVIRQVITPITAVMTHAFRRGWCDRPHFDRPKEPPGRTRWLSPDEAARLVSGAPEVIRPMVILMLSTGARLGEAMFLEWAAVDLQRGHVSYLDTKNGTARGVPLHPSAVAALANLPHRVGRVFLDASGAAYRDDSTTEWQVRAPWRAARKAAGLGNDVTPHVLRHTWASWFYAGTRDIYALMRLGGWKDIKMVQRYTHINVAELQPGIMTLPLPGPIGENMGMTTQGYQSSL